MKLSSRDNPAGKPSLVRNGVIIKQKEKIKIPGNRCKRIE